MISKRIYSKFTNDYESEGLLTIPIGEIGLFSCKKCGACVLLPDNENTGDTRNLEGHSKWHSCQDEAKSQA